MTAGGLAPTPPALPLPPLARRRSYVLASCEGLESCQVKPDRTTGYGDICYDNFIALSLRLDVQFRCALCRLRRGRHKTRGWARRWLTGRLADAVHAVALTATLTPVVQMRQSSALATAAASKCACRLR